MRTAVVTVIVLHNQHLVHIPVVRYLVLIHGRLGVLVLRHACMGLVRDALGFGEGLAVVGPVVLVAHKANAVEMEGMMLMIILLRCCLYYMLYYIIYGIILRTDEDSYWCRLSL